MDTTTTTAPASETAETTTTDKPVPESRPLFGPAGGDETKKAEEKKVEAEVKKTEEEKKDEAHQEEEQEERAAASRARMARERSELQVQQQEIAAARKELEATRALKAKLDKFKEDPLLLLEEYGHKFEDVSKRALSAPRTDPRTLELKAEMESTKQELQKIREDAQGRELQKVVLDEQGKIAALLDGADYKAARLDGWTAQRVWGEMDAVFRATGKIPKREDVLDLVKKSALDRRSQILEDAIAAGEVVRPAPKTQPGKKTEPAKTIASTTSAPPEKTPRKRTLEEKLADALRERPIFDK